MSLEKARDIFLIMASVIIIIGAVSNAKEYINPILISIFITLIFSPLLLFIINKGFNETLSLIAVILSIFLILTILTMFLGSTIGSIREDLPEYDKALKSKSEVILKELKKRNIKINKNEFDQIFNTKNIIKQFSSALKGISSFISNMLIVILLVSFMLIESIHISQKIRAISRDSHLLLSEFRDIIHTYISLKSIISLVTAILVAILLSFLGVNYPLFWAVVAFFLNFIPNIGSLIAAVPAVLLAFIQYDFTIAIIVAIGYLLINFIMGNMVEPKMMGKGMGLSTLIVFISLLVWGWILGPVGMLHSVPLTMLIKLFFEKNSNTKWIAFIIDSKIPGLKS